METDRGLAITGKNAISSWEQKGHETTSNLFEYALKFGQWFHVATVVNRDKNQLSTFLNGRMVGTSSLDANELPELRLSDWFVGHLGHLIAANILQDKWMTQFMIKHYPLRN